MNSWDQPSWVTSWTFTHWTHNLLENQEICYYKNPKQNNPPKTPNQPWPWFEMFFQWKIFYHASISPSVAEHPHSSNSLPLPNLDFSVPWQSFPLLSPQFQLAMLSGAPTSHGHSSASWTWNCSLLLCLEKLVMDQKLDWRKHAEFRHMEIANIN